jgi:Uncharacterized conserved protein
VIFSWSPDRDGSHTLKAVVDAGGSIAESNEANNEKTKAIEVAKDGAIDLALKMNFQRVDQEYDFFQRQA